MRIHTVKSGESIADIAKEYGVSESSLRHNNGLSDEAPAIGEQLLVLTPTRTYTVRRGDSLERISLRFGVPKRDIILCNPHIGTQGLKLGDELTLRYDEPIYGLGASNGYFYRGCSVGAFRRALPYMTYVTVAEGLWGMDGIASAFDSTEVINEALAADCVPLLRIYDTVPRRDFSNGEARVRYCDEILRATEKRPWRGVVLCEREDTLGYADFLALLRGKMIGRDLILVSELGETRAVYMNEYSDASALSYEKYEKENPPSFEEGEKKLYSDFACTEESTKTFINLPALAKWGRGYCDVRDAIATARQYGCEIHTDESTLLSRFTSDRRGDFSFASLESIKATLDIISEYGFMGISFDIMRTPTSHLMMYTSLFRTARCTSVREVEGCSRGRD